MINTGQYFLINEDWINTFLTEKSGIRSDDDLIQKIAQSILKSPTLKTLVQNRFLHGNRFLGWTTNGSKGFTEVSTGDIWMSKSGNEVITLGYECINSQNKYLYEKIGMKFALLETNVENREKFAQEILAVEARAMYMKCKLVSELGISKLVKDYYLEIYNNALLTEEEKITGLQKIMIERGVVCSTLSAYSFYQGERYDEFILFYRNNYVPRLLNCS